MPITGGHRPHAIQTGRYVRLTAVIRAPSDDGAVAADGQSPAFLGVTGRRGDNIAQMERGIGLLIIVHAPADDRAIASAGHAVGPPT